MKHTHRCATGRFPLRGTWGALGGSGAGPNGAPEGYSQGSGGGPEGFAQGSGRGCGGGPQGVRRGAGPVGDQGIFPELTEDWWAAPPSGRPGGAHARGEAGC
eukprot:7545593-Pyramimonas_sp.AAC.1